MLQKQGAREEPVPRRRCLPPAPRGSPWERRAAFAGWACIAGGWRGAYPAYAPVLPSAATYLGTARVHGCVFGCTHAHTRSPGCTGSGLPQDFGAAKAQLGVGIPGAAVVASRHPTTSPARGISLPAPCPSRQTTGLFGSTPAPRICNMSLLTPKITPCPHTGGQGEGAWCLHPGYVCPRLLGCCRADRQADSQVRCPTVATQRFPPIRQFFLPLPLQTQAQPKPSASSARFRAETRHGFFLRTPVPQKQHAESPAAGSSLRGTGATAPLAGQWFLPHFSRTDSRTTRAWSPSPSASVPAP